MIYHIFRIIRKTTGETEGTIIITDNSAEKAYDKAVNMVDCVSFTVQNW